MLILNPLGLFEVIASFLLKCEPIERVSITFAVLQK